MLKRVLLIILALIFTLSIASCGSSKTGNTNENKASGSMQTDYSKPLYDKMTEWSIMTTEFVNAPTSADLLGYQEMSKKFNIKFKFEVVSSADFVTKVNLALSSGNPPNMIWYGAGGLAKYYDTGMILDLTNLVKQYAPDFLKAINKDPGLAKNVKDDKGKYYFIPRLQEGFDPMMMGIYKPWLDQLKLAIPKTTDELYKALKGMKTLDPKIIPWTAGQWNTGVHSVETPIYYAYGTAPGWFHFKEGEYLFGPYERKNEMKEALKYLNKLYSEGIIDKEYMSVTHDIYMTKVQKGEVGFVYGWTGGKMWSTDASGKFIEPPEWVIVPALQGPKGTRYSDRLDAMGPGFHIMKTHPDPEKAVRFLNWLFTEEGINFTNWGVEGNTYKVENGKKVYTDAIIKHKAGIMNGMRSNGLFMNNFTNVTDPKALEVMLAPEMIRGISANAPYFRATQPMLSPTQPELDIETQLGADITALVNEMLPQFVAGKVDIDKGFDTFIKQLEQMNVKKYIENKKAQYKRWQSR